LPQVVERSGWNVWMVIAGCCSLSNVAWVAFAKGPWLRRRSIVGPVPISGFDSPLEGARLRAET
jgi:hypothetical protein